MTTSSNIASDWLRIECAEAAHHIENAILQIVDAKLRRKGVVVGISGGIDSSVVAALAVRALGPNRVLGLILPERESENDSRLFAEKLASQLGIDFIVEEISPTLEAAGCYARRDAAIRTLVPEYGPHHSCKLVTADMASGARYAFASLVVRAPDGTEKNIHLTAKTYLEIVAASNFKQRVRAMFLYYHADRLQYAVAGTPNRLEFDQGFFVKNGDGSADLKPIAHLYKSQVQQLAEYLDIPSEIRERRPTTDTFSLQQSQEEFFFGVPLRTLDLCLYGLNHNIDPEEIADRTGLRPEQVRVIYTAIDLKRKATAYLHTPPLFAE